MKHRVGDYVVSAGYGLCRVVDVSNDVSGPNGTVLVDLVEWSIGRSIMYCLSMRASILTPAKAVEILEAKLRGLL